MIDSLITYFLSCYVISTGGLIIYNSGVSGVRLGFTT